jgi:hypothetical protein
VADVKVKPKIDPKVFDVAKPGKPAAAAPKITPAPHRSMMTSAPGEAETTPEAKPETSESSSATPDTAPVVTSKVRIEPLSKPEDLTGDTDKPADEAADTETTEERAAEAETDEQFAADDESESRDKLKNTNQDQQDLIDSKAAERQANYDKLVLAKTYFLPINQVVRRRSKHFAIAGIVLSTLLVVAWVDVAVDAGIVNLGFQAPTNFFGPTTSDPASTTPAATTKQYVSKVDKASFSYPYDWELNKTSGATEFVTVNPPDSAETGGDSPTFNSVIFNRNPAATASDDTSSTSSVSLQRNSVTYQKIKATTYNDTALYLRQVIVQRVIKSTKGKTSTSYWCYMNIVDNQTIQQETSVVSSYGKMEGETFASADNSSRINFGAILRVTDSSNTLANGSMRTPQDFAKHDPSYEAVKAVLLSLKLPAVK